MGTLPSLSRDRVLPCDVCSLSLTLFLSASHTHSSQKGTPLQDGRAREEARCPCHHAGGYLGTATLNSHLLQTRLLCWAPQRHCSLEQLPTLTHPGNAQVTCAKSSRGKQNTYLSRTCKMCLLFDPGITPPGMYPKKTDTSGKVDTCKDVQCYFK